MMMCSRCGKRPAVVFLAGLNGTEKFEKGYCLTCAKEMGVPQVNEYLKQMGITDEDLENGLDMLMGMGTDEMNNSDDDFSDMLMNDEDDDEDSVGGFQKGGANILPPFMEKFFGGTSSNSDSDKSADKDKKEKKAAKA